MRILLVEDDGEIREFLRIALQEECFAVDAVGDGNEGSYLARTNDYDLIILDNNLPGKTGYHICSEIRDRGKSTPIMVLSVDADVSQKVDMFHMGADDYLTKPYSLDELIARMRALLRRPKVIQGDVLKVEDLVIDTASQAVTRGEEEIYLTSKEYALLEFMAKNAGKVLSRGIITEHVWNREGSLMSNTIEAHIRNLRRKVDQRRQKKLIQTIPRRGYRMGSRHYSHPQ